MALDGTNRWTCTGCSQQVTASKRLQLYTLPEVLVLHLKRFEHTEVGTKKLQTVVDFPVDGWDLSDYVQLKQVLTCLACIPASSCMPQRPSVRRGVFIYFCPADLAPMCSASVFVFKQANSGLDSVTAAHSDNLQGGGVV